MKQPSLFDDAPARAAGRLTPIAVPGSAPALSKAQKLFNALIRKIEAQRQSLQQWRDYETVHRQRVAAEIGPMQARLLKGRIAMVALLDQALDAKALGKTQRAKVREILLGQLSEVLSEAPDADLIRLYDKHSDVSFEEEQQDDRDFVQAIASDMFGVELDAEQAPRSPEELAQLIAEKMAAEREAEAARPKPERKKSAKAAARQAEREQAAQGASRSLREVYRQLASALHPDREPDLEERARKTALMQQANRAYEAGDLLALLELQLQIEQIDPAALAGVAEDRLAHYNLVLEDQLRRLQEELSDLVAPFAMALGGRVPRQFGPELVQRAMDEEVRELELSAQQLEADLIRFQDIKVLKSSLKHYRLMPVDDDEMFDFADFLMPEPAPRRRR